VTRSAFTAARRYIIKVGSALVQAGPEPLSRIAADIAALVKAGKHVALVSSGAVALGRPRLGLSATQLTLEQKQAAAAAGQPVLVEAWEKAFAQHDLHTAQALLTLDVTETRRRWLNARGTLMTLLECGVIPVVNENDTVATDELRYGDNDRLAARVAQLISADVLVLLSDVDGLYEQDPRSHPDANLVREVNSIDAGITAMAGEAGSSVGTGGMQTKLLAAEMASAAGCATVVALGTATAPISRLAHPDCGTWFHPAVSSTKAREIWISGASPDGALHIDAGAARALLSGKSLLPVGVVDVSGSFERGDTIRIVDQGGVTIARGVSAYDAADARRIQGCKSTDIEAILGFRRAANLVHADDLVLARTANAGVAS
jgi:glutamate 5-kinase